MADAPERTLSEQIRAEADFGETGRDRWWYLADEVAALEQERTRVLVVDECTRCRDLRAAIDEAIAVLESSDDTTDTANRAYEILARSRREG